MYAGFFSWENHLKYTEIDPIYLIIVPFTHLLDKHFGNVSNVCQGWGTWDFVQPTLDAWLELKKVTHHA